MHFGLNVAATLVDVELHGHVAIVLQRKEQMIGILDLDGAVLLDVAGVHRTGAFAANVQHSVFHILGHDQCQGLEPLHDLVDVFEHALHGLMLVHHSVEAEAPDGTSPKRREQQAPQRVAERVAEATLEWLEPEFSGIRIVVPFGHLDQVRTHQSSQINGHGHFALRIKPAASWAGDSRCAESA
jgi:hypothetical protein